MQLILINRVLLQKVNQHLSLIGCPKPHRIFMGNLDVRHLVDENYQKFLSTKFSISNIFFMLTL